MERAAARPASAQLASKLFRRAFFLPTLNVLLFFSMYFMYFWVVRVYGSDGYTFIVDSDLKTPSLSKTILGAVTTCLLSIFVGSNGRPSNIFVNFSLTLIIIPTLVLHAAADLEIGFYFLNVSAFMIVACMTKLRPIYFSRITGLAPNTVLLCLILILSGFLASIIAFGGLSFLSFDITAVYDIRGDAERNLPSLYAYLNSIITKAVIPYAIILAIYHRMWLLVAAIATLSVFLFAVTAHRAPIFFPFVVLFVYFSYSERVFMIRLASALVALSTATSILVSLYVNYGFSLGLWFGAIIGNRAMLLPSLINYSYYDFFLSNPSYYWSDSKITMGLLDRFYEAPAPSVIGLNYFGREGVFANTGWIGSGMAQAGPLGVILYSFCLGSVFLIMDGYQRKFGSRFVVSAFCIPALFMITSADFVVMFLTHGLIVSFILVGITNSFRRS